MSGKNESTVEFDELVASGEIEVGAPAPAAEAEPEKKSAAKRGPPREPAKAADAKDDKDADEKQEGSDADAGEEQQEEGGEGDEGKEQEEGEKPRKSPAEHQIDRLKREKAALRRELQEATRNRTYEDRLAALEKRGLPDGEEGDKSKRKEIPAPDPTDTEKYPLGHLDDRYIEDKIEWVADQKVAAQSDAALQRQQDFERNAALQNEQRDLLGKVDDLAARGADEFEDFQELVVDTAKRQEWDLSQPTFEAAHEADHGAQILYELSQDKKEAARVARLSPYQQLKFVQERDAAIAAEKTPRRKPGAPPPPQNQAQGRSSKVQGNPATDDLDNFEDQWKRDAKSKS